MKVMVIVERCRLAARSVTRLAADLAHALGEVRAGRSRRNFGGAALATSRSPELAQGGGARDLALLLEHTAGEATAVGVEGVEGVLVAACGEGRLGALERGGAPRGRKRWIGDPLQPAPWPGSRCDEP